MIMHWDIQKQKNRSGQAESTVEAIPYPSKQIKYTNSMLYSDTHFSLRYETNLLPVFFGQKGVQQHFSIFCCVHN